MIVINEPLLIKYNYCQTMNHIKLNGHTYFINTNKLELYEDYYIVYSKDPLSHDIHYIVCKKNSKQILVLDSDYFIDTQLKQLYKKNIYSSYNNILITKSMLDEIYN
jgi:hypothetical protein